jgi:ribose transport system ATP-binding protein
MTDSAVRSATRMQLRDIHKSYGSNHVLKGVDLRIEAGQVHALLGANGAGKSTLLGCLSGAEHPDSGTIVVNGHDYAGFTPRSAFEAGTSIIYQHFQLIGDLTVADNVFLGSESTRAGALDKASQVRETRALLETLGVDLDPHARVESLSVGEQQIVEIVRALRRQPHVLILDEPTAALGTHEVDALLALVRRLAVEQDIAIIYVTHLLGEVFQIADAVTVLRDGRVHLSERREDLTPEDVVRAISPDSDVSNAGRAIVFDRPVLRLEELRCSYTGPVSLTVHAGEIVGVFGLLGSGRTNLLETLAGVRRAESGTVGVDGETVHARSPYSAIRRGISLVASDRKVQSLFGSMTAAENVLMPHFARLSRVFRRPSAERRVFGTLADEVGLRPKNPSLEADNFSGGNAQKLAVARWVGEGSQARVLLLDEPTQGVDIGARHELYELIRAFAARGDRAVLFASSDPEEIVSLADRVIILVDGRPLDIVTPDLGEEAILALAQSVDITSERTPR